MLGGSGTRAAHEGTVALVTGVASGIGEAVAAVLGERGEHVLGMDLQRVAGQKDWVVGDMTEDVTWETAIGRSVEIFGSPPGILVLNAARFAIGSALETPIEEWQRMLEVNVLGAVRGLKACLPVMAEGGGGSVVVVASVDGYLAERRLAAYCSAKGALLQLTRSVAIDFAPFHVRANCVCPAATETPSLARHLDDAAGPVSARREKERRQPLGILHPRQVAEVVAFLASDRASGMTGSVVTVDGGLSATFDYPGPESGDGNEGR